MHYFTDKSLPPWMNIENCSVPLPLPQYIYSAKAEMLKKKDKKSYTQKYDYNLVPGQEVFR